LRWLAGVVNQLVNAADWRSVRGKRRLSKKLHLLPSSIRRIIQAITSPCGGPVQSHRAANSVMERNSQAQPPDRQRTYIRLRARVDRLEDAISHFYNVINELRRRVSMLEKKKSKPLAKR